jgi:DICT domain-containing protein
MPEAKPEATGLTIGELAERTGVPAATLRTWESRHGVPLPLRLPGGHRRYAERDVALVEQVLRHRAMGLSLETAVAAATAASAQLETSVFAGLRRRHRELVPRTLSKRTLLALTRAMEDECCARAAHPILFGGFQRGRFYRRSRARWQELARTAAHTVVFADFTTDTDTGAVAADVETLVALPASAPLGREWLLVCDAVDHPACLTGWEVPGPAGVADADRRYETVWTLDPPAVRVAARICAGLAESFGHTPPPEIKSTLAGQPAPSADLRRASGLLDRMVGYVDAAPPAVG